MSTLYKNDTKWVLSSKFLLKILFQSTNDYIKYKVSTCTLDTFVKKNNIRSIDILKVDIDGSEYDFLKGAKNTLKKNKVKVILIEVNDKKINYEKKEKKVISFLNKRNFFLIKKHINHTVTLFSNSKSGDYLFINENY